MRLIATDTLKIVEFAPDQIPDYAILSHRWGAEEVTLQEVQQGSATSKQGFRKVQQCCAKAKTDGYGYVWVDTCCIDKTSSTELSEAINSMYTWYYQAAKCYAFMADVPLRCTLQESEWFARGWTLQELLAPQEVCFLDEQWVELGTKATLQQVIHERTGIPIDVLSGAADLETKSVAQRMSWAANRQTTRLEDRAYSLLGIFGIHMPLLYGEGEQAFTRLQEEIMKTSNDHSLFAWASADSRGGLLATSPAAFAESRRIDQLTYPGQHISYLSKSNRGIELEARIIGQGKAGLCIAVLNCKQSRPCGCDQPVGIWLRDKTLTMEIFERVNTETILSVDLNKFLAVQCPVRRICIESGRIKPLRRPNRPKESGTTTSALNSQISNFHIYDDSELNNLMEFGDSEALVRAAQDGNEDHVWLLLSRSDITVDQANSSGFSALSAASAAGHTGVVRLLLARGAAVNAMNASGMAALHYAAMAGRTAVVELIVGHESAAIDLESETGWTPLLLAVQYKQQATAKVLLARGSSKQAKDSNERTILLCAAENGDDSMVKMIMDEEDSADDSMLEIMDKYGRTPLRAAAENGHTGTVTLLLTQGARVDATDNEGMPTLHWAALNGSAEIARALLDGGAEVDALDGGDNTALLYASVSGNKDVVKVLLDNGADVDARDKDGWTAVWNAAAKGDEPSIKLLMDAGSDINATADQRGTTALHWALSDNSARTALLLVKYGASIDAEPNSVLGLVQWAAKTGNTSILRELVKLPANEFTSGDDRTPIGWAAREGHGALVRKLLDEGANVNATESEQTLLSLAAGRGHEAIVRLLLDRGANVNQSGEEDDTWTGTTPLSYAANYGYESIVKLLLDRDADPDGMWIIRGRNESRVTETPLHNAMRHRHHHIIKMLLDYGASPNLVGTLKHATLWHAVHDDDPTTVKMLAEAGANLEFKDFDRETALHFAAGAGKHKIVRILLDAGASVNTTSEYGRTPLWNATYQRDAKMVGILLDAGANIEKGGDEKETPLSLAYNQDCPEIAKLLLERGAKTDFLATATGDGNHSKSKKLKELFRSR